MGCVPEGEYLASVAQLRPRKKLEEVLAVNADDVSRFEFLGSGMERVSARYLQLLLNGLPEAHGTTVELTRNSGS